MVIGVLLYVTACGLSATPSAAPSFLTATAFSPTRIDLTWADNSRRETCYIIERSGDGVSGWTAVGQVGADITVFTDPNCDPNTTYYYRVQACTANASSDYAAIARATTPWWPLAVNPPKDHLATAVATRSGTDPNALPGRFFSYSYDGIGNRTGTSEFSGPGLAVGEGKGVRNLVLVPGRDDVRWFVPAKSRYPRQIG
jgi:hypothetical protein